MDLRQDGVDTLAIMPTGAGKSLTYQLAAMLRPSPTLVLSPLGAQQSTAQTVVGAMFLLANAVIARTTGDYFDAPA